MSGLPIVPLGKKRVFISLCDSHKHCVVFRVAVTSRQVERKAERYLVSLISALQVIQKESRKIFLPSRNDIIQVQIGDDAKDKIHPGLDPYHGQVGVDNAVRVLPNTSSLFHSFCEGKNKDAQKEPEVNRSEIHGWHCQ